MSKFTLKCAVCLTVLVSSLHWRSVAVTFQGAQTNQVIDGFGVNINYRSWNGNELQPVVDALIDQAGMTHFRVVYEPTDWEAANDDADPNVFNWSYYNGIYSSTEFMRLWNLFAYLNSRGITNGAFFNFMGWGPGWMTKPDTTSGSLKPGMESEWAEMIASMLVYARNTMGLQFSLVAPDNEPDLLTYPEGIHIPTASQYANALHKLAIRLNSAGIGDVGFVGPDVSAGGTTYMPEMMADPVIMAKLKHFGVHSYNSGGQGSSGVRSYIANSAYADRTFWLTEFGVMCQPCEDGIRGNNDWSYARGTVEYLLAHLLNGASGSQVWEGYDSRYAHGPAYNGVSGTNKWSYWGLIAVDNPTNTPKTYTPRKQFYTHAQVSRWVRPGAQRINVTGATSPFSPLLAFKHTALDQLTIVGINTSGSGATLKGTNASLLVVPHLDLYYTSATTNLAWGSRVPVTNGTFSATIPANCVFTLTYSKPSPVVVTTTNLPSAKVGENYSFTLNAIGGIAPYLWGLATNVSTPAGLTLATNGVLSGVPSTAGQFVIPVVVTDAVSEQVSQEVGLGIVEVVVLTLDAPTQTAAEIENVGFRLTFSANLPGTYLIQRAPDFSAWEEVSEVVYTNGVVQLTNRIDAGTSRLYYRAAPPSAAQ
ncbi:MAG TPA: putative Ig domain-containing protein [Candidatus Paceibacterota bacterium]|nr:putative Ig domain-containing protein [Verrucomicrobiota bacterium]HSA10172.1 putative Ig domain-containing protein [Candidatus Paceibacterota bacterium]